MYTILKSVGGHQAGGRGRPAIRKSKVFWVKTFGELSRTLKKYEFSNEQKFYLRIADNARDGYCTRTLDNGIEPKDEEEVAGTQCVVVFYTP